MRCSPVGLRFNDNRTEMTMKRMITIGLLLAGAVLLWGCKHPPLKEAPNAGSQAQGSSEAGASTSGQGLSGGAGVEGNALGGAATGALARTVIYFDFDKSEIKPEFADVVSAHARNLTSHPNLKMKLEDHAGERGPRENKIGLGERRAQAVRRALMLQGVAESQVTTVSFGAERPAAEGDDESAWAKNRRGELVYLP